MSNKTTVSNMSAAVLWKSKEFGSNYSSFWAIVFFSKLLYVTIAVLKASPWKKHSKSNKGDGRFPSNSQGRLTVPNKHRSQNRGSQIPLVPEIWYLQTLGAISDDFCVKILHFCLSFKQQGNGYGKLTVNIIC